MGDQSLRQATLRDVFQDLHGEGLGHPLLGAEAEWAAQRIKGLSLKTVVLNMFVKPKETIKTLIEKFDYPAWAGNDVERRQGEIEQPRRHGPDDAEVARILTDGDRDRRRRRPRERTEQVIEGTDFISSMPLTELIAKLDPPAPPRPAGGRHCSYRDFLTVCLIVNKPELLPGQLDLHPLARGEGRPHPEFQELEPGHGPDRPKTSLGLEYFCNEGDDLWTMPDRELIELAKAELEQIGLARAVDVEDGCVVRVPKTTRSTTHSTATTRRRPAVRGWPRQPPDRRPQRLHRYNNQDHQCSRACWPSGTAGGERNDLWSVNTDPEYHEEVHLEERPETAAARDALSQAFARLDGVAFGLASGLAAGLVLFLATITLVIKGGPVVGPNLPLLSQYFQATLSLPPAAWSGWHTGSSLPLWRLGVRLHA